jgi:hypothetical protein
MLAHRLSPFVALHGEIFPWRVFCARPPWAISIMLMPGQERSGRITRAGLSAPGTGRSQAKGERLSSGSRREQAILPSGPHRSSSNVREAFSPSLMVRYSKIFINTPNMIFGKISGGCTD